MFFRLRDHLKRHHAVHVAGAQLGVVAALCVGLVIASASAWPAYARLDDVRAATLRPTVTPGTITRATATTPAQADAGLISLQDLSPEQARLWNASNPISTSPNPAAKPFKLAAEGVLDEARALDCMTAAIYYEAAYESADGQRAVAQVVLNRLRNPLFPKTVCGVVFQGSERATGCQFTFTCDGALARKPTEEGWARARKVAAAALNGQVMKQVGNATHYHAAYVAPYWSPSLVKVAVIGQHIFYRWTGGLGRPPAFGGRYAGGEANGLQIATLDSLAQGQARLALDAAPASAEAAPQEVAVVEAAPAPKAAAEAVVAAAEEQLVTASSVAADAGALLQAEELDWQGRPRQKSAPRVAMPGGF
ncbi:cell wall hydrolase [Phenylobacterium sp. LjRoot219]|uniref:cell wall hydrolase n=1 Tax=Phenylobacterium sp. LjRoot219 TaxID=3342283 RepID=UPI003ECFFE62